MRRLKDGHQVLCNENLNADLLVCFRLRELVMFYLVDLAQEVCSLPEEDCLRQ